MLESFTIDVLVIISTHFLRLIFAQGVISLFFIVFLNCNKEKICFGVLRIVKGIGCLKTIMILMTALKREIVMS